MIKGAIRTGLILSRLLISLAFVQPTLTNPAAGLVFHRNVLNEASLVSAGISPPITTLIKARFVPLMAGQGALSTNLLRNTKVYRGIMAILTAWYWLAVRVNARAPWLAERQVNWPGVSTGFVIARLPT